MKTTPRWRLISTTVAQHLVAFFVIVIREIYYTSHQGWVYIKLLFRTGNGRRNRTMNANKTTTTKVGLSEVSHIIYRFFCYSFQFSPLETTENVFCVHLEWKTTLDSGWKRETWNKVSLDISSSSELNFSFDIKAINY